MNTIVMKNTTGKRSGNIVRFEFGRDLFGYIFLDVIRGKQHRTRLVRSMLFDDPGDFMRVLDTEVCRGEDLDYLPHSHS